MGKKEALGTTDKTQGFVSVCLLLASRGFWRCL